MPQGGFPIPPAELVVGPLGGELIGRDAMLKLFKYFRGDKIDCPMRLYRPEFIADLAKQESDRRERAKIARAGGYTVKFIEGVLSKRRKENETE